jgi:hypothetical protein
MVVRSSVLEAGAWRRRAAVWQVVEKARPWVFQSGNGKRGFPFPHIFNDLPSLKMVMHPCIVHRLLSNRVFQQPARESLIYSDFPAAQGCAAKISRSKRLIL